MASEDELYEATLGFFWGFFCFVFLHFKGIVRVF